MQSITWYVKRIQMMSAQEVVWRLNSLSQAWLERCRVQFSLVPEVKFVSDYNPDVELATGFSVFIADRNAMSEYSPQWRQSLISKAEMILAHQLSYFDLQAQHLETPINWHKDHSAGIYSSLNHITSVNYRDFANNGDCKLVWEPNRHHQIVVLARAYKVTGELKYAEAVIAQLTSWLDANPYGRGMNWRSPLELAIRLINWVWAIDLIKDSGLVAGEFKQRLLSSVYLHCRDVSSKFSQGTSANNHLVGEAAGVYIACCYFDMLADAEVWRAQSKKILENEIQAQTFADGCTKEHAFSYQFFVWQFYLFTGLTGQWKGDEFSPQYWSTLDDISQFIATIAQGGSDYPMLGDQDDGYVLDLGDHVHDLNALCDISAHYFNDDIFLTSYQQPCESAFWLCQQGAKRQHQPVTTPAALSPVRFADSGYFLLQAGCLAEKNQASILFDCADLGYTAIAAHGHADALSLVMRINNNDLLVDTGTFDYFTHPQWRNHFRSTAAHNTLTVDGLDQSVMTGPFMWEQHAQTRCISWQPSDDGGKVIAEHNGYQRLTSPVIHQRSITLSALSKAVEITDKVTTNGEHSIGLYFHFSEYCRDITLADGYCRLQLGSDNVELILPLGLTAALITGQQSDDPELPTVGWLSRGYHQKTPITTLVLTGKVKTESEFKTLFRWY